MKISFCVYESGGGFFTIDADIDGMPFISADCGGKKEAMEKREDFKRLFARAKMLGAKNHWEARELLSRGKLSSGP